LATPRDFYNGCSIERMPSSKERAVRIASQRQMND
jgi:hypothetical protein